MQYIFLLFNNEPENFLDKTSEITYNSIATNSNITHYNTQIQTNTIIHKKEDKLERKKESINFSKVQTSYQEPSMGFQKTPNYRLTKVDQAQTSYIKKLSSSVHVSEFQWLVDTQEVDGHWLAVKFQDDYTMDADIETTALVLLSFLSQGHTTRTGRHKKTVKHAIE